MDGNDNRPLSVNDFVGLLLHNANQMAAHLATNHVNSEWDNLVAHLGIMHQDLMLVKKMIAAQSEASATPN